MTFLRSKLLILTVLVTSISISSIGFASPPIPQVSVQSLMYHLGIKGFRSNIVGTEEYRAVQVEILKVENGQVVDTFSSSVINKMQMLNPETMAFETVNNQSSSTVDVIYEKLNRSKYKFTVLLDLGIGTVRVPMDFTLDWQGTDSSHYPSVLTVNANPILFTGEIYEDTVSYLLRNNIISQTDLNTNPMALRDAINYLENQGVVIPTRNEITNIKKGLMIKVIGWPVY